jgi:hypothetical protein
MLDRDEALIRARNFLAAESRSWETPVAVLDEAVFVHNGRLIAPFNSVAYIEGQKDKQLGGNLPVEVSLKTGECRFIELDEAFEYMDLGLL